MHPQGMTGIDVRPIPEVTNHPELTGKFNLVDFGPPGHITSPKILKILTLDEVKQLGERAEQAARTADTKTD